MKSFSKVSKTLLSATAIAGMALAPISVSADVNSNLSVSESKDATVGTNAVVPPDEGGTTLYAGSYYISESEVEDLYAQHNSFGYALTRTGLGILGGALGTTAGIVSSVFTGTHETKFEEKVREAYANDTGINVILMENPNGYGSSLTPHYS
ncbi:hypothetical protein [Virgibacillus senegalensis]|uniref:hypothetical protein n=1 Tax=Virgibacillus senegalensis TaxID=1499679 RepID=UPI00069D5056|nr:hypothetical protein [Virgibacillus senegalensis]